MNTLIGIILQRDQNKCREEKRGFHCALLTHFRQVTDSITSRWYNQSHFCNYFTNCNTYQLYWWKCQNCPPSLSNHFWHLFIKFPIICCSSSLLVLLISSWILYFTDYKTHFFHRKIASKIHVRLILEINIKMSIVWFKIPAGLKNGHIFDATGNLSLSGNIGFIWQQQCTDATKMSSGIHKLTNTVSLPPCHHKHRTLV